MKIINLSVFMCALLLISCGKSNSKKNSLVESQDVIQKNEVEVVSVDLSNRSTEEVLALKYDKAVLTCSLWSQNNKVIDLEQEADDSVSIDLKNSYFPQVLKLSTDIQGHQVKIILEVTELSHNKNSNHIDSKGNKISTKYSPYVKINYSSTFRTNVDEQTKFSGSGSAALTIYERIPNIPLNKSVESKSIEDRGVIISRPPLSDYLKCIIETEIKPEFKDQFEYISAKN